MHMNRCYISLTIISECLVDLTGCLQLIPTCCDGEGHNIWRKLSAIRHTTIHFNKNCSIFTKPSVSTVLFIALEGMKWIYFVTSADKTSQTLLLFQTNSSLVYCADKHYSVLQRLFSQWCPPKTPALCCHWSRRHPRHRQTNTIQNKRIQ